MLSLGLARLLTLCAAFFAVVSLPDSDDHLPFHLRARATNKNGSTPLYKNANAAIEDRVNDLLPRMTVQEKVSQL